VDRLVPQQDPPGDAAICPTWPAQPKKSPIRNTGSFRTVIWALFVCKHTPLAAWFFFLTFSLWFVYTVFKSSPKKGRCQQKHEITTYLCAFLICFFWRPRGLGTKVYVNFEHHSLSPPATQGTMPRAGAWEGDGGGRGAPGCSCTSTHLCLQHPSLAGAQPSSTAHPTTGFERQTSQGCWQEPPEMRFPPFLPLFSLSQTCLLLLASSELVPIPCVHPPGSASLCKIPFNTYFALL